MQNFTERDINRSIAPVEIDLREITNGCPALSKDEFKNVIKMMSEEFPKLRADIKENELYKKTYDEEGLFFRWLNKGDMEKIKANTIFLLAKSSRMQMDSITVIFQLSILLNQMQCKLNEQQEKLSKQQDTIKAQQCNLEEQNNKLSRQQDQLEAQNDAIKGAQQKLSDDNDKLLNAAKILQALRQVGEKHDNEIDYIKKTSDDNMSGIEKAMLQVMLISDDLKNSRKQIKQQDVKIDDVIKQISLTCKMLQEETDIKMATILTEFNAAVKNITWN